jgi:outer membrane protein OmpA-like peptidoglycan-associated protein
MLRSILFKAFRVAALLTVLGGFGCGGGHKIYYEPDYRERFYVPKQIPLKPEMLQVVDPYPCKEVTLVNDHPGMEKIQLAPCGRNLSTVGAYTHQWWADLRLWTDTSLDVVRTELVRRGVKVTETAPKTLKLSLTSACLRWDFRVIGCHVSLRVETGDGYIADFDIDNKSVDLYDSCDGAVTRAVAAMFNHPVIRAYLSCPPATASPPRDAGPRDSDGDGVPDDRDKCPGTPKGVKVDEMGCPLDSDGDGVPDYKDRCPGTPKGAKVDEWGCWIIPDIQFEFDKHEILPQYRPILDEVAEVMKMNPGLRMILGGHTCTMGTEMYNERLSENRAEAVKRYLVRRGAEPMNILAKWYYFSRPKVPNDTEEGRSRNRRTELEPVIPLQSR